MEVENSTKTGHCEIQLPVRSPEFDELVVGFDDEAQNIIDRLTRGSKNLDVVSILGMAGLGKTTLAKKVYRHHSILHYFHARSWCTISQVYNKKSSLLEILNSLESGCDKNMLDLMSTDDLANVLRKSLKGKKYLIILDDVWDIEVEQFEKFIPK
ncbi:OLC1v1035872C1 [Oldenlandia corymbosa var. corymbosa]|uniref:OLC1v1035872C1 n=1 Tax=Oldenlandia corymbosa var. corymbosa TaxID=529605 RepID=A0AAV1CU16_OLDCO|nr:OLC1v1035872C1 [Oldenlandia corymbosa var. corymbosa]